MTTTVQELLAPEEVAKILKVSKRNLYHYMEKGYLPFVRVEKRVRFRAVDVERFIQQRLTCKIQDDEVKDKVKGITSKIAK